MDYESLARGFVRALRGKRSQTAFSRRLGYRSNVAYAWESGRRFPTAAETLRAAARTKIDVHGAVSAFLNRQVSAELAALDPASPAHVAAFLRELRGPAPMERLAERSGLSRSTISRILAGKVEPRLPLFLALVDAATRRVLDLLAGFVDPSAIPEARDEWARLTAIRRLSYENPLAESVPRVLELEDYTQHRPGFVAERLGISLDDEERTIEALAAAGSIRRSGARWEVERERSIDTTRFDPRGGALLRAHWAAEAAARMRAGQDGKFAYLVFTTDEPTLAALHELQRKHFRELRALVASSPRNTRIAVANFHIFTIDQPPPERASTAEPSPPAKPRGSRGTTSPRRSR
jgi:transcriptional regulator with XRE-family HTH domain